MHRLTLGSIVPAIVRIGLVAAALALGSQAKGADCSQTSVGLTPLPHLGLGLYLGRFAGGLYPNGSNAMPAAHGFVGSNLAWSIEPRAVDGAFDPSGKYVLLSIGMSNTTQEFCNAPVGGDCTPWSFMGQASAHEAVDNVGLAIVDGARGGQSAATWDSPTDANYDRVRDEELIPRGLSEAQVAAVWVKVANPAPSVSLPAANADAYTLLAQLGDIVRSVRQRYPNVRQVFLSSRIYAGYASTMLNPEPYAYESGFAVKWLIQAQIEQMAGGPIDPIAGDLDFEGVAPWLAWGPYLWADGITPGPLGLTYECSDLQNDGTHPSQSGQEKVADRLLAFMLTSPLTMPWFRLDGGPNPADLTGDAAVDGSDLGALLSAWGTCDECPADYNGNGVVNGADLGFLLARWD